MAKITVDIGNYTCCRCNKQFAEGDEAAPHTCPLGDIEYIHSKECL